MKKLLIAALLPLACLATACATIAQGASNAALVAGVEATEAAARARCPRSAVELGALRAARTGFDVVYRSRLLPSESARVDEARRVTNDVCGLI
ncbi:MAG TPA: hypothetical protein VF680_11735 [Allosphingosinicella sp.]|jgi:predicted small secreted protein